MPYREIHFVASLLTLAGIGFAVILAIVAWLVPAAAQLDLCGQAAATAAFSLAAALVAAWADWKGEL